MINMKFDNKYFALDSTNSNELILFYDNNIYSTNRKKPDFKNKIIINTGFYYAVYLTGTYCFEPALEKFFRETNYNSFMIIIRLLSLFSFLLTFFLFRRFRKKETLKDKNTIYKKINDESYLNYSCIKKNFKNNIILYSFFLLLVLLEIFVLFFWFKHDYFYKMLMIVFGSILGIFLSIEDFISSFVWMFGYLKRHKNDEK